MPTQTPPLRLSLALGLSLLALSIFGFDPSSAIAQTTSATAAIAAEGFVPVPGGKPATEEVNASLLVLIAYAMFALGFIGYLLHLARTQNRIAKDIQLLGQRLDQIDRGG